MSILRPRSNRKFARASRVPFLTAGILVALSWGLTPSVVAEPMQLKTSDREVYGSREIESGNYSAGIRKLQIALQRTEMRRDKAPILNNLCVAYVASSDLESAATYCELAVENGYNLDLAYNNRGVMHFTAGNVEQSIHDLDLAVVMGHGYGIARKNLALLTDQ